MSQRIAVAGVVVTGLAVAGVAASLGTAALDASRPPAVCPRLNDFVRVEFGDWGGEGTPIPARRGFALAGSEGANRPGGFMIFGSATAATATTDRACRRTRVLANPSRERLSKPFLYRRTKSGYTYFEASDRTRLFGERLRAPGHIGDPLTNREAWGVSFRCAARGPVTIVIVDSRDAAGRVVGSYFSARVGRELLGTAVLRRAGNSFFRVSRRCEQL
jgi:hypothetical protein